MIKKLSIENFRSIQKADLPLAEINVFTGANNSGKSSVIYAMLAYQSFMDNPNRALDQILAFPFINLGGFKETVFDKNDNHKIALKLDFSAEHANTGKTIRSQQKLVLHPSGSRIELTSSDPEKFVASIDIALPYALNKTETYQYPYKDGKISVNWNGFTASANNYLRDEDISGRIDDNVLDRFILPFEAPKVCCDHLSFVPIERGFKKPFYGAVPLTSSHVYSEDEIATTIAKDTDLAGKISHYLEKIVDRSFVVNALLGTSSFRLQTRDRKTGFTSDLVNEGLGTNQLITLLAKILEKNTWTTCVDEPEAHLHPSAIDKFIDSIVEIGKEENRQYIISTHSEHIIQAILSKVRDKKLNSENVNIFYTKKNRKVTEFELQPINEKGQIEGGLKSFYEEELKNMKDFFKVD